MNDDESKNYYPQQLLLYFDTKKYYNQPTKLKEINRIKKHIDKKLIREHCIRINGKWLMHIQEIPFKIVNNGKESLYFSLCDNISSWFINNMGQMISIKSENELTISWELFGITRYM